MTGPAQRPAPWYSCSGKEVGNYADPRDPTRFITCDASGRAIEFDCPPDANSPTGRMIYDEATDRPVPYDEAEHAHLFGGETAG
ncbi:chitin binding peritrophin-A domain-containing protein [Kitasatospora sp. NPDC048194]|uniref:chitin binding peritrophin-A domain-containing protein n=1 Tax=Kitasatospora sp. NPDC048194 TaxID=3364045 RepID=UPI00371E5CFD